MAAARLPVFPTRQNLQVMKVKLTGAKKGHSLLKKKADALTMRLRALLKNIIQVSPRSRLPTPPAAAPWASRTLLSQKAHAARLTRVANDARAPGEGGHGRRLP